MIYPIKVEIKESNDVKLWIKSHDYENVLKNILLYGLVYTCPAVASYDEIDIDYYDGGEKDILQIIPTNQIRHIKFYNMLGGENGEKFKKKHPQAFSIEDMG